MALRSPLQIPGDLRARLEVARMDLLALFRALDRMDLAAAEIPPRLLRQLFERDADYAQALWALDQPEGRLDRRAMLRDTLTALDQLPSVCAQFRKQLPARAHPTLEQLEGSIRKALKPKEAHNMVSARNPENVGVVASLTPRDFYKSMTTHADHRVWHDVYRPRTPARCT